MSDPPSIPPRPAGSGPNRPPVHREVLSYQTPPRDAPVNTAGRFVLRSLVGFGIGIACVALGGLLVYTTSVPMLLFLPLGLAIVVFMVLLARYRRFGYITGMLLAPMVIVAGLLVILLMICGGALKV